SVCLRSCNYSCGILDVFRRILRHHWRCVMARSICAVWTCGGFPESGCAVRRVEDLVDGSCATVEVIGPIPVYLLPLIFFWHCGCGKAISFDDLFAKLVRSIQYSDNKHMITSIHTLIYSDDANA